MTSEEAIPVILVDQSDRDRIRTDLDATLFVEAAAGTGKTSEMIERIVAIIAAGRATIDEVFAVTFTEKAEATTSLRTRKGEKGRFGG
jgi:ATP-dependent exoDNAse (exonuclease V) beta subunit